jgi:uncharacterized SAM-binding protein YcdF (DUF218 family)
MKLSILKIKSILQKSKKMAKGIIGLLGWISLIALVLSFTDIPFYIYYGMATRGADLSRKPDYIVMLGGVGMPSPEDLIRTYTTAGAWHQESKSKVIIAFPSQPELEQWSPEILMAEDLILRGVDSASILFERRGFSTRSQALNIAEMIGVDNINSVGVRVVTSPEHMYRAIRVFRKIGFEYVGGTPAFESVIDEDKLIRGKRKNSEKRFLKIRYNMWSYLKYEITILREFCAIGYYKLRGWI